MRAPRLQTKLVAMKSACLAASVVSVVLLFAGCGRSTTEPSAQPAPLTVPIVKNCAPGDHPETALQGQVPAALRAAGFQGFNCNLQLVGQYTGEGGGWSSATFADRAGHVCAYYATSYPKSFMTGELIPRKEPGVAVIDISDPAKPVRTVSLTTTAMMDAWESLRVNPRRQVLAANFGPGMVHGNAVIDFYDLSGDCRHPQLLSSAEIGTGSDGGLKPANAPVGHEGGFAPDGLTYYVGDTVNRTYHAVDVTDLTKPKLIAQFDLKDAPLTSKSGNGTAHGLSISDDGNRAYFTSMAFQTQADLSNPNYESSDGFYIVDTSEVQSRKPNAKIKLISSVRIKDGSLAQAILPIKIAGKSYLVFADEGGSVIAPGNESTSAVYRENVVAACRAKMSAFPMPRIFDISDERNPKLVSKLMLETHDLAHCNDILPDLAGVIAFSYGSHYCSVDNRQNATALACSFFNSGIRVFDIRDPASPKEIAYLNPAGARTKQPGSAHVMVGPWQPGAPDWCTSRLDFDYSRRMLTAMCQDNGLLVMKFENGIWPMSNSTPTNEQTY